APRARDATRRWAIEATLASASPRKPKERTARRSSAAAILLVAWLSSASGSSSGGMPAPSSWTAMRRRPPPSTSTRTVVAPASRLFSMSSFTTLAGRSTTSPAAIWSTTTCGRRRMVMTRSPRARSSGVRQVVDQPLEELLLVEDAAALLRDLRGERGRLPALEPRAERARVLLQEADVSGLHSEGVTDRPHQLGVADADRGGAPDPGEEHRQQCVGDRGAAVEAAAAEQHQPLLGHRLEEPERLAGVARLERARRRGARRPHGGARLRRRARRSSRRGGRARASRARGRARRA